MNILSYLTQAFPKAENKWKNIVFISLFVTLFLIIFQPFGIGQIENQSHKYLFIGGFGLVSFSILIINLVIIERLFQSFFQEKNWKLYKELLWLFCIVFSIGLGNVLYAISYSGQPISLSYIINFQIVTFATAVFPISIFTLSKQNYLLKKHTTSAKKLNENLNTEPVILPENKLLSVYSYNGKAKEEFDINKLFYIESKGNDIELNLLENKLVVSKTLRNTLKKSLEYLTDSPELVQCHRAYIVNLNKVIQVEGNSQGLVLKFENSDAQVPVSRSFVSTIKNLLSRKL